MFSTETFLKFYNKLYHLMNFKYNVFIHNSTSLLIIMSSPGQKRGTCGHVMTFLIATRNARDAEKRGWVTTRV